MSKDNNGRFGFLAHPYWAGIGVIVATIVSVVAFWLPRDSAPDEETTGNGQQVDGGTVAIEDLAVDPEFAATAIPVGCTRRPASYPYQRLIQLEVGVDGTLSRDDESCQSMAWVIERDGDAVISKAASDELQYRYFRTDAGNYCAHIQCYVGDQYRRVSDYVSWVLE